jgi:hypothetical protein
MEVKREIEMGDGREGRKAEGQNGRDNEARDRYM